MFHENALQCESHCISEKTFFLVVSVWRICVVLLSADFPPPGIRYLPVGCWQLHGVPCKDIGSHHCNEHGLNSCKSKLPSWCSTTTASMHHIYSTPVPPHHPRLQLLCCALWLCNVCYSFGSGGDSTFMYYPTPPAAFRTNPFSFGIWYNANVADTFIVPYVLCIPKFCIPKIALDYCIFLKCAHGYKQ